MARYTSLDITDEINESFEYLLEKKYKMAVPFTGSGNLCFFNLADAFNANRHIYRRAA
jgi:hypothetical protein